MTLKKDSTTSYKPVISIDVTFKAVTRFLVRDSYLQACSLPYFLRFLPNQNQNLCRAGESNKLALFIYNANSEFDDAINVKAGCVRRGKDKVFAMLTRLGFFGRTCSEAEEASSSSTSDLASSSRPHVCKQDTVQSSDLLYGLPKGSHTAHTIATWCCGLIVDILKGSDS